MARHKSTADERSTQESPSATKRRASPPVRKPSTRYTTKRLRLRTPDVVQAEAVAQQQHLEFIDLAREQYQRGVHVDSALRAPDENGLYGIYEGSRLAKLLQSDLDALISFALRHGVTPVIVQEYRGMIHTLNEAIQRVQTQQPALPPTAAPAVPSAQTGERVVTDVADEAHDVLNMFFPGS